MVPVASGPITSEEKRAALSEALQSATLARSDRLKNLLRFLCEAEIEGRAGELNEYVIGVQALGQPATYSPAENSAVRSRIYELRQRLEKFYSTEAAAAALRIQLAKGSYIPRFVRSLAMEPEIKTAVAAVASRKRRPPASAAALAAAFAAGALLMLLVLRMPLPARFAARPALSPGTQWTPEMEAIWRPFTGPNTPVIVSYESRLFVRIGSVNVRDWTVDEMAKVESSTWLMAIKNLLHQPQLYENRNYADFGTVQAAFQIGRLLGTRNAQLALKHASELGPEDTENANVIALSKPSTDPALRRLLTRGPFVDERVRVRNVAPGPGEPAEYVNRPDTKDPERSGERYLLISLLPGLHPETRLLSLACFNSEDPWALAEYLTSPEHAREMYAHMHLPNGRMPEFYQVVVKAVFRAQVPLEIEYVTHRVIRGG
jgi:hypothetical protein